MFWNLWKLLIIWENTISCYFLMHRDVSSYWETAPLLMWCEGKVDNLRPICRLMHKCQGLDWYSTKRPDFLFCRGASLKKSFISQCSCVKELKVEEKNWQIQFIGIKKYIFMYLHFCPFHTNVELSVKSKLFFSNTG